MSKIKSNTAWSTILKPSASMPKSLKMDDKRAIFLGFTKDGHSIRVIVQPNATPQQYAPEFWQVDERYMSDREEIAYLKGRIDECDDPHDLRDYENEMDTIIKRMQS